MIGCDLVTVAGKAFGEIANDVFLQTTTGQSRRDDGVLLSGELDRFLAADDWDPNFRTRLLHRARPDRDVLVRPEFPLIGEDVLRPRAGDNLVRLFIAGAGILQGHVMHLVFAWDTARKARDQTAIRQA